MNPAALNSHLAPSEIFVTSTDAAATVEMVSCNNNAADHTSCDPINIQQRTEVNNGTFEHENDGMQEQDEQELNSPIDEARSLEMENEFAQIPDSSASHFFVAVAVGDCMEEKARIASIDAAEGGPESITRFLTLPTITA